MLGLLVPGSWWIEVMADPWLFRASAVWIGRKSEGKNGKSGMFWELATGQSAISIKYLYNLSTRRIFLKSWPMKGINLQPL